MLSKKMQDALNAQINAEYYSSYLYLSMAAYCEGMNLKGFGHWMRLQSQEEMIHVNKFFDYVLDRRGKVELKAIEGPPTSWESPLDVFEHTLKHEQHVTSLINNLADLAIADKDHATHGLLEWFLNEQVEEESVADQIVSELKLLKGSSDGLYLLDKELATRVIAAPAGGAA
jgi:ferritin